MKNPFVEAKAKRRYIKIGLYGSHGVGKTIFALSFPSLAIIDLEKGTEPYKDQFNFSVLETKSFSEALEAITFLEKNKHSFQTLTIDPVGVIYSALQNGRLEFKAHDMDKAASGEEYKANFHFKDWGEIKRFHSLLMDKIVNLQMNIIFLGRKKDEYSMQGDKMIKIGCRLDGEKSIPYLVDIYGELITEDKKRILRIEKSRYREWDQGDKIIDPSYKTFQHLIKNNVTATNNVSHTNEKDAGKKDAAFFQKQESGKQDQSPPAQQEEKSNGNGNGKKITVKEIWTKFTTLKLPSEYKEAYKAYYLDKFKGAESMTHFNQEQMGFLKTTLMNAVKDKEYLAEFKAHLNNFLSQQQTKQDVNSVNFLYTLFEQLDFPQDYISRWETFVCERYKLGGTEEISLNEMKEQEAIIRQALSSENDAIKFMRTLEEYNIAGQQYPEHQPEDASSIN